MPTQAYVDLMFAWGHARLGDEPGARNLVAEAEERLNKSPSDVHLWLTDGFVFRIEQAIAGKAHGGRLPSDLLLRLESIEEGRGRRMNERYVVDRLRQSSRILEPETRVDPYAFYIRHRPDKRPPPPSRWERVTHVVESPTEIRQIEHPAKQIRAACDFLQAASKKVWRQTMDDARALLGIMPSVPNWLTTCEYYSLFHLLVAEATVVALALSDFGPRVNRLGSMTDAEIASRREALVEVRAKLIEWGTPDWDVPPIMSK